MFDKGARTQKASARSSRADPVGPEDERIALRCNRKELQLVDSFVASGEFRNRSELMRRALRVFLRTQASLTLNAPPAAPATGLVEVPVRLRTEEVEIFTAYGQLIGNGQSAGDTLAVLVRRGDLELKVSELVLRARDSVHRELAKREQLDGLKRSAQDLERKGVVGR